MQQNVQSLKKGFRWSLKWLNVLQPQGNKKQKIFFLINFVLAE